MKIIVLGSGLLGVTTAYELGRRGHEVTVLDRQAVSGAETSFANGGQLSYSHSEPWANPGSLKKLPKWLLDPEAPLVFRLRADWQMITWGLQFLRNCTTSRAEVNGVNILRLGLYSKRKMTEIREQTNIAFDFAKGGILHLFGKDTDYEYAKGLYAFQGKFGDVHNILSRDECYALEPALAHTQRTIVGGIHTVNDEYGDAYLYCNELAKVATERHGVKFQYGVDIQKLRAQQGKITAVVTDKGEFNADSYVMAMGSYSPIPLREHGINLPIYPMKGYSITIPTNEYCPAISLTDGTYKVVYSRLGNRLRVAGTAEFAGHNTDINEKRITPIVKAARSLLPKAGWDQDISKWACLRPSTPDGPPIIGKTKIPNLYLNTGHGTLGWTQAAGSSAIVCDIIEAKTPEIILHGLTIERY
ncbi:MAG: D-amino acid dehydrogenase [Rickettsiales bacterium]|nr:D-amino acid dehydrogenase [Rickettsiales bacterium]